MDKKVVLIASATDLDRSRWGSIVPMMVPAPPLNILALASYLEAHGLPVEVVDMQVDFGVGLEPRGKEHVYRRVQNYLRRQGDEIAWIGISQTASTDNGLPLGQAVHEALPDVPIIFGGYFPSRMYLRLLKNYPFIRAVVHGDGEMAALEITRRLATGRLLVSDETSNLAWLEEGELRITPRLALPASEMPLINVRLLRNPQCYPVTYLMTSKGCPFVCNYCLEQNMRPYSMHGAERVKDPSRPVSKTT